MIHHRHPFATVLFLPGAGPEAAPAGPGDNPPSEVVSNRQIHSNRVVDAAPGTQQEADGLTTSRSDLCLEVVTADCVPVLIASADAVAAVHAGWRGLASGILGVALERLGADPAGLTAWIGPAIGPCCYEVGDDVAQAIAARSGAECVLPPPGASRGRPHLDLAAAARSQLERGGVDDVRLLRHCTRCSDAEPWSSYRRDGPGAGRNRALIWRGR